MTDRDEFLAWVRTALYAAELALHNGDAAPRRALWSRNEPAAETSGHAAGRALSSMRSIRGGQTVDAIAQNVSAET